MRRRVKIVDGTGLSMLDTATNQRQWPQIAARSPAVVFPCSSRRLFCLHIHSGALLQVVHDDMFHHDIMLARRLWHWLQAGEILLADRGFVPFVASLTFAAVAELAKM